MYLNKMKGNPNFVGEFDLSKDFYKYTNHGSFTKKEKLLNDSEFSFKLKNLLTKEECHSLLKELSNNEWIEVGSNGILSDYSAGDYIGSYRQSCYEEEFAVMLWERIKSIFPLVRSFSKYAETDWDNHFIWRPVGINPLFRFIKYKNEGSLVAHYDAPFIENNKKRSLMTLVIYLNTVKESNGGSTRFIFDSQKKIEVNERNLADWSRSANNNEVLKKSQPFEGNAILFDHRILHDSEPLINQEKIILRTDIMFEKV